ECSLVCGRRGLESSLFNPVENESINWGGDPAFIFHRRRRDFFDRLICPETLFLGGIGGPSGGNLRRQQNSVLSTEMRFQPLPLDVGQRAVVNNHFANIAAEAA